MIEFKFDPKPMQKWLSDIDAQVAKATATALTRTAGLVRADITRKIPSIFSSVTPATARSILYTQAKPEDGLDKMSASVFVRFEGKDSQNPPERWLRAEIDGGPRRDKRSERVLKAAGIMHAGQQWVQGSGAGGPLSGPQMVQLLSQLGAFGEQGFRANASAATRKRLAKKGVPVVRKTGMQFFVARGRWTDAPTAVYQVVGRGQVRPILWFVDKRPNYRARFHFTELAAESMAKRFPLELKRALAEVARVGSNSPR